MLPIKKFQYSCAVLTNTNHTNTQGVSILLNLDNYILSFCFIFVKGKTIFSAFTKNLPIATVGQAFAHLGELKQKAKYPDQYILLNPHPDAEHQQRQNKKGNPDKRALH